MPKISEEITRIFLSTETNLETVFEDLGLEQYYREKLSLSKILEMGEKSVNDEPAKCKSDLPCYFLKKNSLW